MLDYAAVHDVGGAINPLSVRGQIEAQYRWARALRSPRGFHTVENGAPKTATLKTYHMCTPTKCRSA
jgi:CO/xanthine dehydrogenase Mo-binding subunit